MPTVDLDRGLVIENEEVSRAHPYSVGHWPAALSGPGGADRRAAAPGAGSAASDRRAGEEQVLVSAWLTGLRSAHLATISPYITTEICRVRWWRCLESRE